MTREPVSFPALSTATRLHFVPSGRSFTPNENEKLREVAQRLVKRFGSQAALAEKLKILQPSLSNFILAKTGVGPRSAQILAELEGTTVDALLGRTEERAKNADRYPNRGVVVECARRLGVSDVAINRLRRMKLVDEDDAPGTWWMNRLLRFEADAKDAIEAIDA